MYVMFKITVGSWSASIMDYHWLPHCTVKHVLLAQSFTKATSISYMNINVICDWI